MARHRIFHLFDGLFSRVLFVAALAAGFFLTPARVRTGPLMYLAAIFTLLFALTTLCVVKTITTRFRSARASGASTLGVAASVLGVSALQVCGMSAPFCGMTAGMGVVAMVFPGFLFHFLIDHGVVIVVVSIGLQLVALFATGCFAPKHTGKRRPDAGVSRGGVW